MPFGVNPINTPVHLFTVQLWLLCLLFACASLLSTNSHADSILPNIEFDVIDQKPHDPTLFTQGLIVQNDWLIQSSGLYGKSLLRKYHKKTGAIVWQKSLPSHIFAEGLTAIDNILYLATWKENTLFRFDMNTLKPLESLNYIGEGWGLATDGENLFMSNGSNEITIRNKQAFTIIRRIKVNHKGQPFTHLNELEYAYGALWANVWHRSYILRIDPSSGRVTGYIDLEQITALNTNGNSDAVLNGIAYDKASNAFWITGKLWPNRYLIKLK